MDLAAVDPIWWVVIGLVIVILIAIAIWMRQRKSNRTQQLRSRFKSEYDRMAESGGRKQAEQQLERRLARRGEVDLTDLDESDAESLDRHLEELSRSFVDGPQSAARGMTQLVGRVAGARGYVATEEGVLDLVSVDHPEPVAALRRALSDMDGASGAELTETSRLVFLDARALANRLMAEGRAGQLTGDGSTAGETSPRSELAGARDTAGVGERSSTAAPSDTPVASGPAAGSPAAGDRDAVPGDGGARDRDAAPDGDASSDRGTGSRKAR